MSVMGLDIGTTGCKATIFDKDGNVCAYAYREYNIESPAQGIYELNPLVVWEAVKCVIKTTCRMNKSDSVAAISISSFGEAAIPVGKDGNILHNSILYTDARGAEQCEKLTGKIGLWELMAITGLRSHPMYTICKIMWYKENLPQVYKDVWKFLLFEDFILFKLGNVTAIDYSLASRTMAFNIRGGDWALEVLEAAEIDKLIFSTPVPSGTIVGTVNKGISSELGLPGNVALVTGGHDQVCAAVGGGIIKEGMAINGIGTVECITPAFSSPILNESMLNNNFACVPHAIKDMFVTYAFNFTGGSLLKWYRDSFAVHIKQKAEKENLNAYAILDKKAAREPTDILVLPHFAGSGTPHMDMLSKGAIVGLTFDSSAGHVYRALLEGITYEMLYNIECLELAGIAINELIAVGGGARSEFLMQIKADILGRKITTINTEEAGTLGAAILAGVAIGVYSSIKDAVKMLVKVKKEYYPNAKNHEIYMENYKKYKRLYEAVREVLQ